MKFHGDLHGESAVPMPGVFSGRGVLLGVHGEHG